MASEMQTVRLGTVWSSLEASWCAWMSFPPRKTVWWWAAGGVGGVTASCQAGCGLLVGGAHRAGECWLIESKELFDFSL